MDCNTTHPSWLTDREPTPEERHADELAAWFRAQHQRNTEIQAFIAEGNPWDEEPQGLAPVHDLEQQEERIARTLALLTLDVDDDPEPTPPTSTPHVANYDHIGLEPWAVGA